MLRKLKFYIIGLIPGILVVLFILNQKGANCSGYLPNARVVAETLSKDFQFQPSFSAEMEKLSINEKYLRDSLITNGIVDFDQSKAQLKPCPYYVMKTTITKGNFEITYTKCKDKITFEKIKKW